jgi:hypothetical protein
MVRRESAVEYFKELVDGALVHQGLVASELTTFYIVQLLAGFLARRDRSNDTEPLALQLAQALDSGGLKQRTGLKQIGDAALFVSGFFSDSLRRKLVDVDYYASIGGFAYHTLSLDDSDTLARVFAELGNKFVGFADVLGEVSERSSCGTNSDLLRLYEKWLKTRSRRSGQLLLERGVLPSPAAKTARVQ